MCNEKEPGQNSSAFNVLAARVAEDLGLYAPAIAVMKEMQDNWGEDEEGRYFTFEAAHDSFSSRTVLVGTLHNPPGARGNSQVPTLIVGVPPDAYAPDGCEFMVVEAQTNPSAPMEKRLHEARTGTVWNRYTTAARSGVAVVRFAETFMHDHPGFQRSLKAAADEVIKGIAPRLPNQKLEV